MPSLLLPILFIAALSGFISAHDATKKQPNFIIIFTDDQGYADLGCFGSQTIKTPHLDRLAREGRRFTSFMVPSPVCTPSRAGLLTGSYPKRVGMHQGVLFPHSKTGLNPAEHTIADQLKSAGYATACVGKWHLGHHHETLPLQQGFDHYYGIPYSNDMNHPDNSGKPRMSVPSLDLLWEDQESTLTKWKTPLIEGNKIIEIPVDQRTITRRYTDKSIAFIEENKATPFFLYLAHSMPHVPLYVPEELGKKDRANAYTCVIEHLDEQVGRLVQKVRDLGLAESTYLIFTSDNGPWLRFKNHGGSALPLREGKSTTFEGGQRVPCIMWAPSHIPAGTTYPHLTSTIDLLPTLIKLSGSALPADQEIDGLDISATLTQDTSSPRTEFLYYNTKGQLEGIRQGDVKLLIKTPLNQKNKGRQNLSPALLYNLKEDLSEKNNLARKYPELVKTLKGRMAELDAEITKNARPNWTISAKTP